MVAVVAALIAVEATSRSGVLWRLITFTYQANVLAAAYYLWTLVWPRADARIGLRGAVVLYVVIAGVIWNLFLTGTAWATRRREHAAARRRAGAGARPTGCWSAADKARCAGGSRSPGWRIPRRTWRWHWPSSTTWAGARRTTSSIPTPSGSPPSSLNMCVLAGVRARARLRVAGGQPPRDTGRHRRGLKRSELRVRYAVIAGGADHRRHAKARADLRLPRHSVLTN